MGAPDNQVQTQNPFLFLFSSLLLCNLQPFGDFNILLAQL